MTVWAPSKASGYSSNHPDVDPLWAEDETIGWIYQYFNQKAERDAMRKASRSPRNSREMAVRNQFFTPRYVVEFLTDNTLGRLWYEMTQGNTALKDFCHYLVCRPTEIFLAEGEQVPKQDKTVEGLSQEELLKQPVYIPHHKLKDPRDIKMLDPGAPGQAWRRRMYGMLKPSIGTLRVAKPVRPSVLTAGTECCADRSNPGREAYTGSL